MIRSALLVPLCLIAALSSPATDLSHPSDPAAGLPLFGETALRAAWVFSVADLRLYARPGLLRDDVLSGTPLALGVTYSRSVKASTLISLAEKTLETEFGVEALDAFSGQLKAIHAAYRDVKKGDTYILRALPSEGLALFLNESLIVHIPDDAFARFYLNIWLGGHTRAQKILDGLFPS